MVVAPMVPVATIFTVELIVPANHLGCTEKF